MTYIIEHGLLSYNISENPSFVHKQFYPRQSCVTKIIRNIITAIRYFE